MRETSKYSAIRIAAINAGLKDPYEAYRSQASGARTRGIKWEFTFDSWWAIWEPYYHLRGRGTNGLCMARRGDQGSYSPGNVYLTTNLGNMQDYRRTDRFIRSNHAAKELRESKFARTPGQYVGGNIDKLSHITFKARNGKHSSCNIVDGDLS